MNVTDDGESKFDSGMSSRRVLIEKFSSGSYRGVIGSYQRAFMQSLNECLLGPPF